MKPVINKFQVLSAPHNKGFVWDTRYSSTDETDDMGRWARIGYYNGIRICWISGFIIEDGKIKDRHQVGKPNMFLATMEFPTMCNDTARQHEKFDTIEEAKDFAEKLFKNFLKHMNKK